MPDQVRAVVRRATERTDLLRENEELRRKVGSLAGEWQLDRLGCRDAAPSRPDRSRRTDARVHGAHHRRERHGQGARRPRRSTRCGPRRDAPFVAVNCAAIPETLLESELFGHERGAFTGADRARRGCSSRPHGGTLFLDEIGEMPPALQAKLLRVLEERRASRRVGGHGAKPSTCASSRRPTATCATEVAWPGRFREDLYYRLNVFQLHVPPLRERREDIAPLAARFIASYAEQNGQARSRGCRPRRSPLLERYAWPGNVRELRNVIERAVVLARGTVIGPAGAVAGGAGEARRGPGAAADHGAGRDRARPGGDGGNRRAAAERLGISLRTLQYRIKEFGL